MIKFGMFSYNFAYTIMSHIQSKQSFYSTKKSLIINLKEKLQKQTLRIWLAHLLDEMPCGFELGRNWSIQLR